MDGKFEFIGSRPMKLRGRDGLVYSFNPGDITDELRTVVVKFPRLFKPVGNIVETPTETEPLAEVTPAQPTVEGGDVIGEPKVLTEVIPDKPTVESTLPNDEKKPKKPVVLDGLSEEMDMKALRAIAKPLGLKTGRISKAELIALIREARKNENL